jgi:hypothetical protein
MAGLTAAGEAVATALKTQAMAGLQEEVYRNNEFMGLFETVQWMGGSTFPTKHQYAGNTSFTTYVEGDAPPAPGSQSYITASWPETHYHGAVQITGHAMDYTRNGSSGAVFFDVIARELEDGLKDGVDKVTVDMLGSGTTAPIGIQGIVDEDGTIAGLARATYTWFKAVETAGGTTTVAISDLDILQQDISDSVLAGSPGKPDLILCSYKQERIMHGIAGFNPGLTNSAVRKDASTVGGNFGNAPGRLSYSGMPIHPMRDLTDSVILMLTRNTIKIAQCRPWTVDQLAKTDDTSKVYITAAFGLVCTAPRKNGKITTLTA